MAAWEYRTLAVWFQGDEKLEHHNHWVTGNPEKHLHHLPERLNELGEEEWELAGVHPHSEDESALYVFKRPKSA